MYQVYILKLEENKYFIGYTRTVRNLNEQIEKMGNEIEWMIKYPFIKILKIYNNCDKFDVDKYTKKYMEVYGIENVRGGIYYNVELGEKVIEQIKKEFEVESLYNKEIEEEEVEEDKDYIEDSFDKIENEFEIINKCARCGSDKHYSYQCFNEFDEEYLVKRCKRCKEYGHLKNECPITKQQILLEQFQRLDNKISKMIKNIKNNFN